MLLNKNKNNKLVRVESADGTKRLELSPSDTIATMYDKVFSLFKIDSSRKSEYSLYMDRARKSRIAESRNTRVSDTVAHGDLVYLLSSESNGNQSREQFDFGEEDQVDVELAKQDGKIHRQRDEQL